MQRKTFKKRVVRIGMLATNVLVLAVVVVFVVANAGNSSSSSLAAISAVTKDQSAATAVNPLDQASSADIALTVAQLNGLPETTAISNTAQTQAAEQAVSSSDGDVLSKPQVVATALKSRADIQTYVAKPGDTASSLAVKFGVTSNSIRWSNSLTGDAIVAGTTLTIPPVNGIVYTVLKGDTPDSLATKFKANKAQIVAYNDAEISGLIVGSKIIIPNATQPTVATVSYASNSGSSFPWGTGPIYGSNGYDPGYCTWYVATQIAVPSNWGNASSWAYYARLSGWTVSSTPKVGAIAQTPYAAGGEGHVAIVTAVSADGSQIEYKDMNGIAGFDRVGQSGWTPVSRYPNYIYH